MTSNQKQTTQTAVHLYQNNMALAHKNIKAVYYHPPDRRRVTENFRTNSRQESKNERI